MLPLSFGDPIRLGPYRLAGVLGEGGMGKVYFGHDNSGRSAAVKVLRPELGHDQHLAQRFVREAQTAQAVTSKGIARVLGAQTEGGRPWIATEYLAGPTLDQAVAAHGPLDEAGVRGLARALASTLKDIHAAGLVHRDLKPANIVLTSSGPRIIDFGIARPTHGLTLTTTGQAPATPGYGAPEQILGQRVDPSADVFSFGAVLVYAASGKPAYDGPHVAAVQYEVVHGSPDLGAVPPSLQPLIAPCLAKDPAHRPQPSALVEAFVPTRGAHRTWKQGALGTQIKEHEARADQFSTVTGTAVDHGSPSRRRFLASSLAVGGAVLAMGGGGTAWWLTRGPDLPAAGDAPAARLLTAADYKQDTPPTPLWGPLKVAGPDASQLLAMRDVVMFAHPSGGLAAHLVTNGKRKWNLPEVSPSAGFLQLTDDLFLAADADGKVLAFDASTSERRWSVAADAEKLLVAATKDSTVYAVTKDNQLTAIDTADHKVRWKVAGESTIDPETVAAAEAGRLVVCTADGTYIAVDAKKGDEAWRVQGQTTTALTPAIEKGVVYLGGKHLTALQLASGAKFWSTASESLDPAEGWSSPAIDGNHIAALDSGILRRVFKESGTLSDISWPDSSAPSRLPPVVESKTLWIIEGGRSSGVSAFTDSLSEDADLKLLWTYEPDSEGPWHMAAAGNRVFLLNKGTLVAMPVF
ncbi:serine/threonine-protein kinase [Streptomyces sp. NPDC023998]|uniref:serine/threonine-protein kinase n=1 Tax=Streptomyces sp. NPDC023998 TaxID=3154597 RepID=UPI0033DE7450